MHTYMHFAYLQRLGDSVFTILWFVRPSNDLILRFVDSFDISVIQSFGFVDLFDVAMIWSCGLLIRSIRLTFVRPSWLGACRIRPKDVIFKVISMTIWTLWLDHIVGPSSGFRRDLISMPFTWFSVRILPQTVSLMINTLTRCSNITVHYDLYLCS